MIKDYLKNYRGYRELVKDINCRIAAQRKLGIEPDEDLEARDYYTQLVADIDRAVGLLRDPGEQRLLRLRYIEGWSWTKVGFAIHYSRSQIKRIHAKALGHLEEVAEQEGLLWEE